MREADAIEFLRTRVVDEGYIVIGQVPDATGARQRRTIDALLVQCWPSRGLSLTAVEYKATVSDFRRELKQPDKAEAIAAHCEAMLILAPKDVVPVAELPPAWGLWEIHKTPKQCRLLRTVAPQPRVDRITMLPISFLVSVLRARERYNGDASRLAEERRQDREAENRRVAEAVKYKTQELRRRLEKVAEFEEASGIDITRGWGSERLGKGLREFLKDPDQFLQRVRGQRNQLNQLLKTFDEVLPDDD